MYNNSYEEYIRSILGYSNQTNNPYASYNFQHEYDNAQFSQAQELENCYPEIYKIVYPMITKICNNCETPITRDTIERMTDEIYSAVESNNEINININLGNEMRQDEKNRNTNNRSNVTQEAKKELKESAIQEKMSMEISREDRQFRNRDLRDLIQILIIRELFNKNDLSEYSLEVPSLIKLATLLKEKGFNIEIDKNLSISNLAKQIKDNIYDNR